MADFANTLNPTSFGFYDSSVLYQNDANKIITFIFRSLGEDYLSVELTKKVIWNFFEQSTRKFESMIIEYQATSNLASLLGITTGSINPNNYYNSNNVNLTNMYVKNNIDYLERMAEAYITNIGLGGTIDSYSGSITLELGRQDYNLYTDLKDDTGNIIYDLFPSGSKEKMIIHEVFHTAPIQYLFNGTIQSNFVGVGASPGSSVADARFYVLPVYEDVLRGSMLKTAQKIRRSQYSYRISGKQIRFYPVPNAIAPGQEKIWLRVGFKGGALPSLSDTLLSSGSSYQSTNPKNALYDSTIYGASHPGNVPFGVINYDSLNAWARNWIAEFTLANCKYYIGLIRAKYKEIQTPGVSVSLNGDQMLSDGKEDKDKLLTALKEKLDSLSYDKIAEREFTKAEFMSKQLALQALPPKVVISWG